MSSENTNRSAQTRRKFISQTTLAAAAVAAGASLLKTPVYGQTQAPSAGRVIGANDRINVAYIGVGEQGCYHIDSQKQCGSKNNTAQVAVADVSKYRTEAAKATIGGDCKTYTDYRKLLEDKSIDAVCIATHDIWHARCAMDAMNAGKHVYVEKPLSRYLPEAFEVCDTVKKTGKILQAGAQFCSEPKWHKVAELIKAGKLGPLVLGQDSYMRNSASGEWNSDIKPWATADDIDWKMWMGAVKKTTEFSAESYFRWRKYYPYCAGVLGDLFPHRLHPLMMATGAPEFPTRVVCLATHAIHADKQKSPPAPERDVPENVQLIAEFPSGLSLIVICGTVNEQGLPSMIRGHKATVYMSSDRVDLKPEKPFSEELEIEKFEKLQTADDPVPTHEKNWFDCIRANKQPNANIELALRVQTVISLGEMSERLNTMCLFDEKTRKVTDGGGREITPLNYGVLPLS